MMTPRVQEHPRLYWLLRLLPCRLPWRVGVMLPTAACLLLFACAEKERAVPQHTAAPEVEEQAVQEPIPAESYEDLDRFIEENPEDPRLQQAVELREALFWQEARDADTEQAYVRYLREYPQGRFAAEARKRRENAAWQRTVELDTEKAYAEFLLLYGKGPHGAEARERLQALADNHAFQKAVAQAADCYCFQPLNSYLSRFPQARHRDRVNETARRIREIQDLRKAPHNDSFPHAARPAVDGGRHTAAVMVDGDCTAVREILTGILMAMVESGWISTLPDELETANLKEIFAALSVASPSDLLVFPPDLLVNCEYDTDRREQEWARLRSLLKDRSVDVILAVGAESGGTVLGVSDGSRTANPTDSPTPATSPQEEQKAESRSLTGRTPPALMLAGITDPSALCPSAGAQEMEYLMLPMQEELVLRQVHLLYDLASFNALGVLMEDTPAGRARAGLRFIETAAQERGFDLKLCSLGPSNAPDLTTAIRVANRVGGFYIPSDCRLNAAAYHTLAEAVHKAGVPTIAADPEAVKAGMLLSLAPENRQAYGRFCGRQLGRILNGALPARLESAYKEESRLHLNMDTARKIHFSPAVDLLMSADHIIDSEETPMPGTVPP